MESVVSQAQTISVRDFVCTTCGDKNVVLNNKWQLYCKSLHVYELPLGAMLVLAKNRIQIIYEEKPSA